MLDLILWAIAFIISLIILIKASNYFIDSAEKIGIYIKIPTVVVGATIIAIGTSLPELVSSIIAVNEGHSEIVIGVVIGSNIANISLILGILAILAGKLKLKTEINHHILFLLISTFFLIVMILDGKFCILNGVLGIAIFFIYFIHLGKSKQKKYTHSIKFTKCKKTVVTLLLSPFFIYLGAKYTITSIIELSKILGIGKEVIAISVMAFGTSLPELVVSLSIIKKGNFELAISNIVGSNIFNSLVVMGIPALVGKLTIPEKIIYNNMPLMVFATILCAFVAYNKEITKREGIVLVLFYIAFIGILAI